MVALFRNRNAQPCLNIAERSRSCVVARTWWWWWWWWWWSVRVRVRSRDRIVVTARPSVLRVARDFSGVSVRAR
eukprot:4383202-Lingulodinium_polyedra.AAC.2